MTPMPPEQVVLVAVALEARRPLGSPRELLEQPTLAAEVVEYLGLLLDRLPAQAAQASSSSVTHSVWHKDFK